MDQKIIVLYAGQFDMTNENGQQQRGTSVSYYFADQFHAQDNKDGTKGMRPAKCTMDYHDMAKIPTAPALYNAKFSYKVGSDGKPVLRIDDLQLLGDVQIVSDAD